MGILETRNKCQNEILRHFGQRNGLGSSFPWKGSRETEWRWLLSQRNYSDLESGFFLSPPPLCEGIPETQNKDQNGNYKAFFSHLL